MQRSRRQLLCALGAGVAVGAAGCSELDRVTSGGGSRSTPEEGLPGDLSAGLFAPDRFDDADHRRFAVRDAAALREHSDHPVASALLELPTAKAEEGFGLDPDAVEAFARYRPTEILVGSFSKSEIVSSYREDDWTVTDSYHGFDEIRHPERPEHYASGVGDGVIVTTARAREIPVAELVRAHAEAFAGEADRYRDDPDMADLLSVIGGGEYVSAITRPLDVSDQLQYTRAVGRSLEMTADGVAETMAFVFDESAPRSPIEYVEEWAGEAAGSQRNAPSEPSGLRRDIERFLGSASQPSPETGADGRIGYFTMTKPEGAFDGESGIVPQIRDGDPTVAVERRVDEQFARNNPPEPPDATFGFRTADDDPVCGTGGHVVELTYESGPEIPARRLYVGSIRTRQFRTLQNCGYEIDETIAPGETISIGFQTQPNDLAVFWNDPHGGPPETLSRA